MVRIGSTERRARLVVRHRLACETAGPAEVARDLVALHATDAASVYLAVAARVRSAGVDAIERALYEERTLVRILGMRRTVFVVPVELVPVVHAACTRALVPGQRRLVLQLVDQAGVAEESDAWLRRVEDATVAALSARGEATAAELSADVPE